MPLHLDPVSDLKYRFGSVMVDIMANDFNEVSKALNAQYAEIASSEECTLIDGPQLISHSMAILPNTGTVVFTFVWQVHR